MPAPLSNIKKTLIISVIADESTVTGFLLTGLGQRKKNIHGNVTQNYLIASKDRVEEIEEFFDAQIKDSTVGIVLIAQSIAELIRDKIVLHEENEDKFFPTILEIPSKDVAYDPTKDTMLVRAAQRLYGQEQGMAKLLE